MKRLLTALLISAAAIAPAYATQAKWRDMERWSVVGDPAVPYCSSYAYFPGTGNAIYISLNPQGWSIGISGQIVVPGTTYTARVSTKNKYGTLVGTAVTSEGVKFPGIPFETIKELANAPFLKIEGIGKFSMKGSMEAIIETAGCYKALTDIKASVSVPAVSFEREI